VLTGILILFLLPLAVHAALYFTQEHAAASAMRLVERRMLPSASADREARLMVFTGRTGRWRGIFSVHSWVVFKPENATSWSR